MPARNRQHLKSKREILKEVNKNIAPSGKEIKSSENRGFEPWSPNLSTAFKILLSSHLCAAVWSNISDCDEVFNYWEPMHFLLHRKGFQTWEYSPVYAIRSYAYLWLYALPCYLYQTFLQSNKILVFYYLRCILAFFSALSELYLYKSVLQHFGPNIGRLTLAFLTISPGFFIASTAFLPSSFSMYVSTIAFAAWCMQKYEIAIFATAASTLIGWPFVVVLGLPIAYDIIAIKKKVLLFARWSAMSLFLVMIPLIWVDSRHFGKLVVAPLNIVLYNVFTPHGPDLYGTEPCSYYFLNGLLNFNIVFLLALASMPAALLIKWIEGSQKHDVKSPPAHLCLLPMYLWMTVFFPLGHKEERFLFPIYPMICLAGAFSVDAIQKMYHYLFVRKRIGSYLDHTNFISIVSCLIFLVLSLSRTVILYRGFHAPMETFMELGKFSSDDSLHPLPPEYPVSVCIGKEWYRFPSSFFLPDNWELKFIKSEFRGQLPKPYASSPNATMLIPTDMNDQNLEETSRYVDIKTCDYIIDSDFPNHSILEPQYSRDPIWNVTFTIPFLDSQRSHKFFRAFYVPFLTESYCTYVDYNLLQRTNIKDRLPKKRKRTMPR